VAFAQIGDIQSVLLQGVHVLALITTIFKTVKKRLSLENPLTVGVPSDRDNIKYSLESHGKINILRD